MKRIVSGGQTGVDRGALDAALDAGFPCGGFCPPGREAEDGRIPDRYPLTEMPAGGSLERTIRNVEESDGTLVIHFGPPRGGTERTVFHARRLGRPILLINGDTTDPVQAVARTVAFVAEHRIAVLNVAGPRASQSPRAHDHAYETVTRILRPAG
ncbi:MAG TPA: putative molybdenum carrier protein [Candidatus Polarisedimenticolia bacterium]|nr:putative molybdenum carrier protein [Candidatus Polarisedimenticolia bacterium]